MREIQPYINLVTISVLSIIMVKTSYLGIHGLKEKRALTSYIMVDADVGPLQ